MSRATELRAALVAEFWKTETRDLDIRSFFAAFATADGWASQPGSDVEVALPSEAAVRVEQICNGSPVLMFNFYASVMAVLCYRYFSTETIAFITPFSPFGNDGPEGKFLLFKSQVDGHANFKELFAANKAFMARALANGETLEWLRDELGEERLKVLKGIGLMVGEGVFDPEGPGPNFLLRIVTKKNSCVLRIEPGSSACDSDILRGFASNLSTLLTSVIDHLNVPVGDLEILSREERRRLAEFNSTKCTFPIDKDLVTLIRERTAANPDKTAIVHGEDSITYSNLERRSNQIACYLQAVYRIVPDGRWGMMMNRSIQMIECILGVWKTGQAFVPIDPSYPANRIKQLIEDSEMAGIFVADRAAAERITSIAPELAVIAVDGLDRLLASVPVSAPLAGIDLNGLAYVIYTSGSTGVPKGVMIEHLGMINHIGSKIVEMGMDQQSRVAQNAPHTFDISIWQFFAALVAGGETIIYDSPVVANVAEFLQMIESDRITVLELVPSYLVEMLTILEGKKPLPDLDALRILILNAETLMPSMVQNWLSLYPKIPIVNTYGATEASDDICHYIMTGLPGTGTVPVLKRPIQNFEVHLVDDNLNLLPIGVMGEILLTGPAVGRGYLNDPERTERSFLAGPLPGVSERKRIYRTGDLGRYLPDGTMEFLGRKDNQVKILGHRIEPGEIEHLLMESGEIRHCIVVSDRNFHFLTAYFQADLVLEPEALADRLKTELPAYMIPRHFVQLDKLPLTANGKIDRGALPDPETLRLDGDTGFEAPVTTTQQRLAAIWQQILAVPRVGLKDHFFDLGGHSLKTTRLANQIHKEFGVKIALRDLFGRPVLGEQARLVAEGLRSEFVPIPAIPLADSYLLSSSQRRLWMLSQLEEGSRAYHMPVVYRFGGELNEVALARAFYRLVERHEILRTIFIVDENGQPRQEVLPVGEHGFTLERFDLRIAPGRAASLIAQLIDSPFDLKSGPLLRAALYQTENQEWVFCSVLHHIISDGWSMGILVRELLSYYEGYRRGLPNQSGDLPIQYKDYAAWQQTLLSGPAAEIDKDYWLQKLAGQLPLLDLPLERPRSADSGRPARTAHSRLSAGLTHALQDMGQKSGATLFMVLTGLVNAILYRYSGQSEMVLGTPVAGRDHPDLEDQIGFYINTLALRLSIDGSLGFGEHLQAVRSTIVEAFDHQRFPFDDLVGLLNLPRTVNRHPLFDVMVVLQNTDTGSRGWEGSVQGLRVEPGQLPVAGPAKFDLLFVFQPDEDGLAIGLEYNSALFDQVRIEQLLGHLVRLTEAVITDPSCAVDRLEFLLPKEKSFLLEGLSEIEYRFPRDKTLVDLFEEQCRLRPNSVALADQDGEVSYRELNEAVNRLAAYLTEMEQVRQTDRVALCLERDRAMIVSLLAVLKCGAAYVPIDPAYPADRAEHMRLDSGSRTLIDQAFLQRFSSVAMNFDGQNAPMACRPDDLAYIIYTSGSTGVPKGVLIEHRNVVRLFFTEPVLFDFDEKDVWTLFHSYSFDFSVWEIFGALLLGGKLVIVPSATAKEPAAFLELAAAEKVTVLNQTPSAFYNLLDHACSLPLAPLTLRYVIFGGEALNPAKLARWKERYPTARLINMYGITETTVHVTYKEIQQSDIDSGLSNIGRPIPTLRCYLLDVHQSLLPPGVPGELYVGGEGVARGYQNRSELTQERFIVSPFIPGERLYRSGDLVKLTRTGDLEYLGRIDNQVKLRGYRIELGEIEAVLEDHDTVGSAVVMLRKQADGDGQLVAYVTGEAVADDQSLRAFAAQRLPAYMLPSAWVRLKALPLTSNGKVDRKALPETMVTDEDSMPSFQPPATATEQQLAAIWEELLGRTPIGRQDDFFALGGHSLKATRLAAAISKAFGATIELRELFARTLLADQADAIDQLQRTGYHAIPAAEPMASYPLSSSQRRLWTLAQLKEANVAYNVPDVYVFEGKLNNAALAFSFHSLMERHEILRTVFRADERGEVRQFILPPGQSGFLIDYRDLRRVADQQALTGGFVEKLFGDPFDPASGPLLRASLLQLSDTQWVFAFAMHHIISDGWSTGILIRELLLYYNAYTRGEYSPLPPLPIQYKDYACWQQQQLHVEGAEQHRKYWLGQLGGELHVLELPTDRPRPAVKTYRGGILHGKIPAALTQRLKAVCQNEKATLFMGLLGVVNAVLYRYTGQQDIIIGSPIAGRQHADLHDQIGLYINTLALRTRFAAGDSYRQLLRTVRDVTLDAYAHQDFPFDEVIEALNRPWDRSRNALFDVWVVLQDNEVVNAKEARNIGDLQVRGYGSVGRTLSRFDLLFDFIELGDCLPWSVTYNSDIFDRSTIERLLGHFVNLLDEFAENPDLTLGAAAMLSLSEREKLLAFGTSVTSAGLTASSVTELFEAQAVKTPDQPAIDFEGAQLTFRALNERANRLADFLKKEEDVEPGDRVAILSDRNGWVMTAILGVLKAGAAYVPIDPEYPEDRIAYMIADSECKCCIDKNLIGRFETRVDKFGEENPVRANDVSDVAYVIYTSGSTGRPKGVMITHEALLDYHQGIVAAIPALATGGNFGLASTIAADLGNTMIYTSLLMGGCLRLLSANELLNPEKMARIKLDCLKIAPSHWRALQSGLSWIPAKCLIFGGEALTPDILSFLGPIAGGVEIYNHYGPTETTIGKLVKRIVPGAAQEISLGKPFGNTKVYVLDNDLNLAPEGGYGEVCIAGLGLARGYWNNPELTAEKFTQSPFNTAERIYRTGDIGRWLPSGELSLSGRKDDQVKIRGFRIELEEIRHVLLQAEGVDSCLVKVIRQDGKEPALVAYLIGKQMPDIQELRDFLNRKLPSFMVPAHFIQLEHFPLTANGKIDHKALPVPEGGEAPRRSVFVAPRNETEEKLAEIWGSLLGLDPGKISVTDNFFELGGHSLAAMSVVLKIHEYFNVEIDLAGFFEGPDVDSLATEIENIRWMRTAGSAEAAERADS